MTAWTPRARRLGRLAQDIAGTLLLIACLIAVPVIAAVAR